MRLLDLPGNCVQVVGNLIRSLRRRGLDYVVVRLEGSFPERASRGRAPFPLRMLPLFPSEVSLEEMEAMVALIGRDERVEGAILRLGRLRAGPPTLHTLRQMVQRLRDEGKRTVAWVASAGTWEYYLASACDEIIVPPSGRLNVLGLRSEALFLKDTLAMAGVEADLESIAEYKVTPDMFRRSTMTEPHREMVEGILDSYYEELIDGIAEGRGLERAQVRELIDRMPLAPANAVAAGLVDAVLYEDELARYAADGKAASEDGDEGRAPLLTWDQAVRWIRRPIRWTTRKRIGVVSVEGMIVPGESRRMPTPLPLPVEAQAGAETVTRALRRAEADPRIAAVILHVDSPGGSSLASDLIWREVRRLGQRKPVVALMGEQAASGGYYVSAPASRIVARPTTMTGSIGIWGGKVVLGGLYDRLKVGHKEVQRGARADLYSEFEPFSQAEREQVRQELGAFYARFKQVVAEGRGMAEEEVEQIARGRVWTGKQAQEVGLVDELGDFEVALATAKELAELDPEKRYTVVQITAPGQETLPRPFPTNGDVDRLALLDGLRDLAREHVWAMAPWVVRVRG
ncbi:MAG: signal peptide peptidase SppA [Anaerolineae bacterium]